MRTTFTIDADIVPKLKQLVRRKRDPMRKVLNDLIRAAIGAELKEEAPVFEVKSVNLGLRTGLDPAKINSLFDELEVARFDTREEK